MLTLYKYIDYRFYNFIGNVDSWIGTLVHLYGLDTIVYKGSKDKLYTSRIIIIYKDSLVNDELITKLKNIEEKNDEVFHLPSRLCIVVGFNLSSDSMNLLHSINSS